MNKFFYIFLSAAVIMAVGCKKDPVTDDPDSGNTETEETTISATLPTIGDFSPVWSDKDCLKIIGTASASFSLTDGAGKSKASLKGTAPEGTSFTVLYPSSYLNLDAAEKVSLESQAQKGNGNMDHLRGLFSAALIGVNDFKDVAFTEAKAKALGGSLKLSSIIKVRATLPSVATAVSKLTISAADAIFPVNAGATAKTKELNLTLEDVNVSATNQVLTAYLVSSWVSVPFADGSKATVSIVAGEKTLSKEVLLPTGLNPGVSAELVLDDQNWAGAEEPLFSGEGTEANPYVIASAADMEKISKALVGGSKVWFKLGTDIDMKDIAWLPVNNESPFDKAIDFNGNGKIIENFTCTPAAEVERPSLLGVLNGSVHDVTFKNPVVGTVDVKYVGVIAGGETEGSEIPVQNGTVSNVTVEGGTINGSSYAGTLVGHCDNITFKGCRVSGVKMAANGSSVGGLAGSATKEPVHFEDCSFENTSETAIVANNYVGGLIGRSTIGGTMKNCTSKVYITGNTNLGGISGAFATVEFNVENCSAESYIESTATSSNANSGNFAGQLYVGTIKNSHATGTMKATRPIISGFVGYLNGDGHLESCWSDVTIEAGQNVGGLAGSMTKTSSVNNCYSVGKIACGEASQRIGGIVGYSTGGTITNCYSTSDITGANGGIGGVIGIANGTTPNVVTGCIAWNGSVTATNNTAGYWSCAAVVGAFHPLQTAANCVRKSDTVFTGFYEETDASKAIYTMAGIFDQDDISATSPMKDNTGTSVTDVSVANTQPHYPKFPYHGKAAAAGESLSAVAKRLGWSADVWDLSGEKPVLK